MRPTARPNRLVGLVTRLDGHIWHQAILLPASQVLSNDILHNLLTFQISISWCSKIDFLTPSIQSTLSNPLDRVQSLLEYVVNARFEFTPLPTTQPVTYRPIRQPVVAAQRLDRCTICSPIKLIDHVTILYSPRRRRLQCFSRCATDDFDFKPFTIVVWH